MLTSKRWRRQRLVDKQVQGHLMWKLFCYFMGYNLALLSITAVCFFFQHCQGLLSGGPAIDVKEQFAAFLSTNTPLLISMALLIPVMLWDMLNTSHRFAGPVYRFRKTMDDFNAGQELKPVKLREGDFLTEFESSFNKFVAELERRGLTNACDDDDSLNTLLEEVSEATAAPKSEAVTVS